MAITKKFECRNFDPSLDCGYSVTGNEEYVINEADGHIVEEHGYQDSPSLRQQIKDSLVDV